MKRKFALVLAVVATIGLVSTIIGTMIDNPDSPFLSALGTLKYFTIQSNIFVAVFFWIQYISKDKRKWLTGTILGAIYIYITITFLGYAVFLESIYNPQGIALLGTVLNHYVTPIMVIAYVITFRKEYQYHKGQIKLWLIYMLAYLIYFMIYGAITNDYYYPFLDLDTLGWLWFCVSVTGLLALSILLACSLIFMSKSKKV